MIVDAIERAFRYEPIYPGFEAAFRFLARPDLADLPNGRIALNPSGLYAIVERAAGRGAAAARLEAHRRFVDIQYVITGAERIGWAPLGRCRTVVEPYQETRDIAFFADPSDVWIDLRPGDFTVLFPEDGHAPGAGSAPYHKIVVKVPVVTGR